MRKGLANILPALAATSVKAWMAATNVLWLLMGDRPDHYRPEAHYMRGPGPKWHAKHADIDRELAK